MKALNTTAIAFCFCFISCTKSYLDKKPDDSLVVPTTLTEIQALLDNDRIMNGSSIGSFNGPSPLILVVGADDYYIPDNFYTSNLNTIEKNVYTWEKNNVYSVSNSIADWDAPYKSIFYSNVALDQLSKISVTTNSLTQWNNIKGSALFYRSFSFFQLSQAFATSYDQATSSTDLGIPLRLKSNISEQSNRASLQETYDQIVNDLKIATSLLPSIPSYKTRPSKPAALALLARVYLSMRDYDNAFLYSDSCLQFFTQLIDYKNISVSATTPYSFQKFNQEIIFASISSTDPFTNILSPSYARVDSVLYNTYQAGDRRKDLFFLAKENGRYAFRGGYDQSSRPFTGLAADEIYLIRAECNARRGNAASAMADLNNLLIKRWDDSFVPLTASDASEALSKILTERRKQLLFRGLRWSDLRRFNRESANITLIRKINNQIYTLLPNDLKFVWPIPDYILGFNPGMAQNPR